MRTRAPLTHLIAAGICWTVGQGLLPDMGLETEDRYAAVSANRGLESLSTVFLVLAGALLLLGALGLSRTISEHALDGQRGGRLLRIGAPLLALGGVWLVAGRGAFNMLFLRATHPDVPQEAGVAVLDASVGPEFVPLVLMLPCLILGPVLLAVGIRRAGLGSWLPLALWVIGIGVFVGSEFTSKAGEVVGIALASGALALIGHALGRPTRPDATENRTETARVR